MKQETKLRNHRGRQRARGNDLEEWETGKEENLNIAWNCMDHQISIPGNDKEEVEKQKQIKRQREPPERYSVPRDKRENHPPETEGKTDKKMKDSFKGQLSPVFSFKTIKDAIFFFFQIRLRERKVESFRV